MGELKKAVIGRRTAAHLSRSAAVQPKTSCFLVLLTVGDSEMEIGGYISDLQRQKNYDTCFEMSFFCESIFVSACLFHHILRCSPLHSQQFLVDKGKEVNRIQLNDRLRESKLSHSVSGVTAEHLQHAFNGVCTFIQATVNRFH